MKNNFLRKTSIGFLIFSFWIAVWYLLAFIINNDFLLPTPHSSVAALFVLMKDSEFYKSIAFTFLRVISGVTLGVVFGVLLAYISYKIVIFRKTVSPLLSIIKATPVVTFITLLWITLSGNTLTPKLLPIPVLRANRQKRSCVPTVKL